MARTTGWSAVRSELEELKPLSHEPPAMPAQRAAASSPVADLLEDTLLFLLAKEWADLLGIYIFQLKPAPFCVECAPEAAASTQVRFCLGLLLVAAALKRAAESWRPGGHRVHAMLGMVVGWATGNACVAALRETSSGALVETGLAALATLVCSLLIAVLQPWTLSFDFADGPWADACEGLLQSVWQLSSKALSMLVMIVWPDVLSPLLHTSLHTSIHTKMQT
jgi:hypothetical protein